ncbi:MAG: hypothetical protein C6P37_06240 [Caldibacillus debilis]|uniref:Uncharacterized protein n=1 Tax=Caldibacillus debilis TaxID=301148 RepID=A0A3E0K609_9BACI|nr:MAG: hypothetical protein BAA03_00755 [Caldibacillus debilis]REJ15263.1 MAG: hypothetical protein C6W57_11615 [Caldibacillus debilis]REJ29537.1 MAG: hypothetical protein C6P37_06240 [Caldibacillus debilis]
MIAVALPRTGKGRLRQDRNGQPLPFREKSDGAHFGGKRTEGRPEQKKPAAGRANGAGQITGKKTEMGRTPP